MRNYKRLLVAMFVVLTGTVLGAAPAVATDYAGQFNPGTLYAGESVWSPSHLYRLTQQYDGNLVLYSMPGNKPFWSSNTGNSPGSITQMQTDGNLVVYGPGHVAIWASGSNGHPGSALFMQDDANVVVRAPGNVPVWATNAQHVAGCTDNSRTQAAQYAASGQFYEVDKISFADRAGTSNETAGSVTLRYAPGTRCAWAVATGGAINPVYIDRSSDGGRTWQGWLGQRTLGSSMSTYTGVFNDSYPYVVRACTQGFSPTYHCTVWY